MQIDVRNVSVVLPVVLAVYEFVGYCYKGEEGGSIKVSLTSKSFVERKTGVEAGGSSTSIGGEKKNRHFKEE